MARANERRDRRRGTKQQILVTGIYKENQQKYLDGASLIGRLGTSSMAPYERGLPPKR